MNDEKTAQEYKVRHLNLAPTDYKPYLSFFVIFYVFGMKNLNLIIFWCYALLVYKRNILRNGVDG